MYISPGNKKMGFATWSITPNTDDTCPNRTALCSRRCYAMKAQRLYPNTRMARERNFNDTKEEYFANDMTAMIRQSKIVRDNEMFRIHEAGDFYNQTYLDKWIEICKNLPNVHFLAFTKSFNLDFSKTPKNLVIIWSIWSDTKMDEVPKDGKYSYAGDCVPIGNIVKKCPGHCDECKLCWNINDMTIDGVFFKIH